jgi:hypothetical protein
LTNLVRAGLARVTNTAYAPNPTVYDGLFPNGTFLTAPTRRTPPPGEAEREPEVSPKES